MQNSLVIGKILSQLLVLTALQAGRRQAYQACAIRYDTRNAHCFLPCGMCGRICVGVGVCAVCACMGHRKWVAKWAGGGCIDIKVTIFHLQGLVGYKLLSSFLQLIWLKIVLLEALLQRRLEILISEAYG